MSVGPNPLPSLLNNSSNKDKINSDKYYDRLYIDGFTNRDDIYIFDESFSALDIKKFIEDKKPNFLKIKEGKLNDNKDIKVVYEIEIENEEITFK